MAPAPFSLIGQSPAGVSLEFGDNYSMTDTALRDVIQIIDKTLDGATLKPKIRRVYRLSGVIANNIVLPAGSQNFKYIKGVGYPFLLGEKSYEHQGYVAKDYKEILI